MDASAQSTSRIHYEDKDVFLSGINMAWVNFAGDLGPGAPDQNQFRTEFQAVRNSGGNVLRLWLNTDGSNTPEFNANGFVTGPGPIAISSLKQILAIAHRYDVGLILCLWSHDMLKTSSLSSVELARNDSLLVDTAYTMTYIRNALIPMVDSVKGDPAIVAWEIFNEPEGISNEFGWSGWQHVRMADIQRFVNLVAGAIHRTDITTLVTSSANSFQTMTDYNPPAGASPSAFKTISGLSTVQQQRMVDAFNSVHGADMSLQQYLSYLDRIASLPNMNYYRDDRLKAAGGDSLGTLDFYCGQFYSFDGSGLNPFLHAASYWQLDKPIVVDEFYMNEDNGVSKQGLYPTLYGSGYAGALDWSWTDFPNTPNNSLNAASDTWAALQNIWNTYRQEVDVFGADWPCVAITNPTDNSVFPDSTHLTITVAAVDTSSTVTSMKFFVSDSLLGEVTTPSYTSSDTSFFSFAWTDIQMGSYSLMAIATNGTGQEGITGPVKVQVGLPPMTNLEAETAKIIGSGITVKSDPKASGGKYLDIETNDTNATVTWRFVNHSVAGDYMLAFGYEDPFSSAKTQFINVNGTRIGTLTFDMTSIWGEKAMTVPLVQDTNTIQMQMSWGYMYLDYLGVPTSIVTSVAGSAEVPLNFRLSQNFPNPFNPSTKIEFSIPSAQYVTLIVYNVLGQKLAELVNGRISAGNYTVNFDGGKYSSGVYFYRLIAGRYAMTNKMMLLK